MASVRPEPQTAVSQGSASYLNGQLRDSLPPQGVTYENTPNLPLTLFSRKGTMAEGGSL